MQITSVKDMLGAAPFFQGLSPDHLATIANCATNRRFKRGEFLFREDGKADHFYLIKAGRVAIESPAALGQLTLQTLGPQDLVGWSWLLPPHVWQYNALAIEKVSTIRFDANCIRTKCDADHDLGYDLMQRASSLIVDSLNAARKQLLSYL